MTEQQRVGGSDGVSVAGQNKRSDDEEISRPRGANSAARPHDELNGIGHGTHWRGQQVLRIIVVLA